MDKSETSFIKAGIIVFISFICLFAIQFVQFNKAVSASEVEAKYKVRSQFPEFQWVFDQWDKCSSGDGVYKNYHLRRQCNSALIEIGKDHQKDSLEVERIIKLQDAEISAALERIEPAWPLSAVGNIFMFLLSA